MAAMQLLLRVLSKQECKNILLSMGESNKNGRLSKSGHPRLCRLIHKFVNPCDNSIRDQYLEAFKVLRVKVPCTPTARKLRELLYEHSSKTITESIRKLSPAKRKKLSQQIEENVPPNFLDKMHKSTKRLKFSSHAVISLQGGAILLTGSNLGLCLLATKGLAVLSSLLSITFPFAAYTFAAVLAGKVLTIAAFFSQPWVWAPVGAIMIIKHFRLMNNRQYFYLAMVNYYIESKRQLKL